MALSREFKETVMELCKDPDYRKELLAEILEAYLDGDISVGNSMFRDYLNGTKAFKEVAIAMELKEPSLRRMVSDDGNMTARNLFLLFHICQQREGIKSAEDFIKHAAA